MVKKERINKCMIIVKTAYIRKATNITPILAPRVYMAIKIILELAEGNEPPPDVDVISLIKELETEKLRADNNKREAEYLDKNSAEKDKEYKKRIAELEKTLKAAIEDMRRNSHIKNVRN